MSALLSLRDLRVAFGTREVVHGLSLDIAPGEKLALVGESGSGKTVSALALLGLARGARVSGQALWGGRDVLTLSQPALEAVRGSEIAMIFQEPMTALNPLFTVGEQIAEVLQWKTGMARSTAWARAVELLADTGITEPARRAAAYPHQISGGQRQRAMIAMALACAPKLLLADEPTTALDVALRGQILDLLDSLQARHGMAVLLITHDLNIVRRFADRVAVMEEGHLVEHGAVDQVLANPQHSYTRRLVGSIPVRKVPALQPDAPVLLKAQALRVTYPVPLPGWRGWWSKGTFVAVKGADLSLRQGETLAVMGESGSGKSTLALAALGLLPHGGTLRVMGQVWSGSPAPDLPLRRAVQVVFQDPFSSLSPRMSVGEIVGEGLRLHAPELSPAQRSARVAQALQEVGLREAEFPGLLARYPHEFSGGQRQRLAIARALVIEPRLLVLDEPTSALDVSIQKQVLDLLQELQARRGLSYLLITHDVAVVRAMAHTVLVMKDGAVIEAGSVEEVLTRPQEAYTRELVEGAG